MPCWALTPPAESAATSGTTLVCRVAPLTGASVEPIVTCAAVRRLEAKRQAVAKQITVNNLCVVGRMLNNNFFISLNIIHFHYSRFVSNKAIINIQAHSPTSDYQYASALGGSFIPKQRGKDRNNFYTVKKKSEKNKNFFPIMNF
jgi:hypothetical protein